MGSEDFVIWNTTTRSVVEVADTLRRIGFVSDERREAYAEEVLLVCQSSDHIVEAELLGDETKCTASLRFAVCQDPTVEEFYLGILKQVAAATDGTVHIAEELDAADASNDGDFAPPDWRGLADVAKRSIQLKRNLWIADFGSVTAKVTCDEALERFVIRPFGVSR